MSAGETIGDPISYGDCVVDMLDSTPSTNNEAYVSFRCETDEGEHWDQTCNLTAYRDDDGITCIVRGECLRIMYGLGQERLSESDARINSQLSDIFRNVIS